MTTHLVLPAAERIWKPWKNGGGEMADIAVVPASAGYDDFKWRIAIARIDEDRRFSNFPETDRTFMVVGGKGVRLTVEGMETARLTHKSPPFIFPGEKPTRAELIDGPVQALNVMVRRGVADTRIGLCDEPASFDVGGEATALLVWARGRADVRINDEAATLGTHDAIIFAAGAQVQVRPGDHAHGYLIEVRSRPVVSALTA
jgi:uncharacterized protein